MKNSPRTLLIIVTGCLWASLPASAGNWNGNHRISVAISPTSLTLQPGATLQFTASVSGTRYQSVDWLVNGAPGGNSTVGTVSASGMYTAPSSSPSSSVIVTAQSRFQPSASASAQVTITPEVSVSISPSSASLPVGQSQQFSATVSGTSNTAVTWLVNGTAGGTSASGTISSSGMYSAPVTVPSGSVTVTAQSSAQPTASSSAAVSIMPATVSVSISPTNASLPVGQSQQFSANVSGTTNTAVSWIVSGILGGNSSLGTVSSTGLYTAPASVPSGAISVSAQSVSYPNSYASATVTITAPVSHSVTLSWTASSSAVAGYNIYRSPQSTGPFSKINSSLDTATAYSDGAVTSGQTYYYATTSVDSNLVESAYSNIAQAIIP